jgi:uncharacterized Ntn-hydrolase superfamily protein
MEDVAGTFSIVAADAAAGEVGCAVQSKYFAIGAVTPWVRGTVGAVATQAMGVVAANGQRVLEALGTGMEPVLAIESVLAHDDDRQLRQLGAVTGGGRAAAFTGAECVEWAGHVIGDGFAVQGNMLVSGAVVESMAASFVQVQGSLVDRLIAALEAGQAAGGDRRGQQAAALVVERAGEASRSRERIDRICDLRVDDHPEPIVELRRLVTIWHERQDSRT